MLAWQWYSIIPARVSLASSLIVLLHITVSFYTGTTHLKPFHLTSIILCLLDLIQDIGYAIPLPCPYGGGFMMFASLSKEIIVTGFIYYLYLVLFHQILDKELLFRRFVTCCCFSLLLPSLALVFLSLDGTYFSTHCSHSDFATDIESPVGYNSYGLLFLLAILLPSTLVYLIFLYLIISIIWKVGLAKISQIGTEIASRFLLSLLIFTVAMVPGVYIVILYLFNLTSDHLYLQCVKISGLCICSLGFFFAVFYFSNVSIFCYFGKNMTEEGQIISPNYREKITLAALLRQPILSEPIIISEMYSSQSGASTVASSPSIHHSNASHSINRSEGTTGELRQSEIPFVRRVEDDRHPSLSYL
jgi:hypothetical protein